MHALPARPSTARPIQCRGVQRRIKNTLSLRRLVKYTETPMKTVFSGIQPSGELHLGNYLGAVRNWVRLQDEYRDQYRCVFCIVDYHAITQEYDTKVMVRRVEEMVVDLLALGIDPDRSLLFLQSM